MFVEKFDFEIFSKIGWRLGLQAVTGVVFLTFILGTFYRSASLYHPQRRAILHLKNQKRKIKDKNRIDDRPPFFDFSTLKSKTVRILLVSTGISAFGINTPIFYLVSSGATKNAAVSVPSKISCKISFIGTPSRGGRIGRYGNPSSSLPWPSLDSGMLCFWSPGRTSQCRVSNSQTIFDPSCCLHVRHLHSGTDSCSWKLPWLRYVHLDLR